MEWKQFRTFLYLTFFVHPGEKPYSQHIRVHMPKPKPQNKPKSSFMIKDILGI